MFTSDSDFFAGLRAIVREMHFITSKKLSVYNLTRREMLVLLKLYESNGIRQRDLIVLTGDEGLSVGIAIKSLVRKGYIFKETYPDDRRINKLFLKKKGLEIIRHLASLKKSVESFIVNGIDDNELHTVSSVFSKIEKYLSSTNYMD